MFKSFISTFSTFGKGGAKAAEKLGSSDFGETVEQSSFRTYPIKVLLHFFKSG
jgi:hypothetical protein